MPHESDAIIAAHPIDDWRHVADLLDYDVSDPHSVRLPVSVRRAVIALRQAHAIRVAAQAVVDNAGRMLTGTAEVDSDLIAALGGALAVARDGAGA